MSDLVSWFSGGGIIVFAIGFLIKFVVDKLSKMRKDLDESIVENGKQEVRIKRNEDDIQRIKQSK